ncbi:MAG: hypothetical protein ACI81T_001564 [Bacteroidia bacterium]|jgi:hypothetical protein
MRVLNKVLFLQKKHLMLNKYPPEIERQMQDFYSSLKERDQRHYAAVEAMKLDHGGKKYIQDLFNIHQKTLKRAIDELIDPEIFATLPTENQRRPGGGRKKNSLPPQ